MSTDASTTRPPASHEAQLDLRTFLTSIHAGLVAPAFNQEEAGAATKAAAAPPLPASARVSMLDAQLDTVKAKIRAALVEHAEELAHAGRETVKVHREVRALKTQVDELESQRQSQVQDRIPEQSPLPAAVAAYARAHEQALFEAYTAATLRALHGAVSSLERFEAAIAASSNSSGGASDAQLDQLAADARAACAEVGIVGSGLTTGGSTAGEQKELAWLGRASPASSGSSLASKLKWWQRGEDNGLDLPAVRLLGPRLEEALRKAETLVERRRRLRERTSGGYGEEEEGADGQDGGAGGGALSPADEVRRKARTVLLPSQGWEPVTTIDLSASSSSNDEDGDDEPVSLSPTPGVGGRGMQLPSRNKQAQLRVQQQQQQQPTCVISQRTIDLVQLAEDTLVQARMRAKHLSREVNAGPAPDAMSFQTREVRLRAIAALLRVIPDIFTLHVALMPTLHPQALWADQRRALQFANDCSHLSAQCVRMANVLLIASNVREELGRLVNARKGEQGEGVLRRAVEAAARGLEEASQSLTELGLRVLNRQMTKSSR
ncbi:ribosome biogenesis protein ytm1 [Tilletia horrida]|nr:ribosome biogenesis protein ytm1 [Tilletia horrida]KAK0524213.1 ribosome biogenesis protein ytm1 [Tilletia horrida]KAK0559980.1 ribosome biogenesis protein ytm1 [Tilletia horrida]